MSLMESIRKAIEEAAGVECDAKMAANLGRLARMAGKSTVDTTVAQYMSAYIGYTVSGGSAAQFAKDHMVDPMWISHGKFLHERFGSLVAALAAVEGTNVQRWIKSLKAPTEPRPTVKPRNGKRVQVVAPVIEAMTAGELVALEALIKARKAALKG
jgi:hypothetical protein